MNIIFKGIVGSQAYGTNTPESDIDIKGVYIQPIKEVAGFSYKPQVEVTKDEVYFEVKRFLELAMTGNPTMLELMFLPPECILHQTHQWGMIAQSANMFLSKKCLNSFGGYAMQQIVKAKNLDKKMNWEADRTERKTVLDFCYINKAGKAIKLEDYLKYEQMSPEFCGMAKLDHMADCYVLYHDTVSQWAKEGNHRFKGDGGEVPTLGFKGIESKNGNTLMLSSIPKYSIPCEGVVYFNKSEWTKHCNDYNSYQTWLKERNTARYVDTMQHGQQIDGKNIMHCRRLIDVATEIATDGVFKVKRENSKELLDIRKGKVKLDTIIAKAEEDIQLLDELFAKADLPAEVSKSKVEELLLKVRGL